MSNPS
jgi:hypothetical protein